MADPMSTDTLELYCRNRAKSTGELTEYDRLLLMDVSDRLCALQAENAEKGKEIEHWKEEAEQWRTLRADADRIREGMMSKEAALISKTIRQESALSRVEAERDAAISDISHICATCDQFEDGMCLVLFYKDYPKDCEHWKWRGVQGEG